MTDVVEWVGGVRRRRLTVVPAAASRSWDLDALRGLAVALMLLDHVLAVTGHGAIVRASLTRLSMPLFFVLAGHLARRVDVSRLLLVAAAGVALPMLVPWVDSPNVLLIYAMGVPVIVWARRRPVRLWWIVGFALTWYANRFGLPPANVDAYAPLGLWGLLAVGALLGRDSLESLGRRLPRGIGRLGRYPLTVYVGHLLLLQLLVAGRLG